MSNDHSVRKLVRGSVFGALALASGPALAASQANGYIAPVISQANIATFQLSSNGSGRPTCVVAGGYRWTFDPTTANGQAMMATLLTAYAGGRTLTVVGTGVCTSGDETISYIAAY